MTTTTTGPVNEPAAEWVPIDQLKPWDKNPRVNDHVVDRVAESIKRFGFGAPILARLADREVIAGHTRLKAAKALGLERVPVRFLDLDPAEAHLMNLADNQLASLSEWDDAGLGEVFKELRAEDMTVEDFAVAGFEPEAIADLLGEDGVGGGGEDPGPSETPTVAISKLGEVYELGPHRLMCGDSTNAENVKHLMAGKRAVMCATDPPYLVDYTGEDHPQSFAREKHGKINNKNWDAYKDPTTGVKFFSDFIAMALEHALIENPAWYQWHASKRQALVEQAWAANGLLFHQQLIWVKTRPILTRSHFMWQHEPCFYGWVEGKPPALRPECSGENSTVWHIDQKGEQDGIHPTQKPLEIFERPIRYHSRAGDIVYEPFTGSGSQLIAAAKLGRVCFAMELAPEFCDVIRRRWTEYARSAGIDPGPGALDPGDDDGADDGPDEQAETSTASIEGGGRSEGNHER